MVSYRGNFTEHCAGFGDGLSAEEFAAGLPQEDSQSRK